MAWTREAIAVRVDALASEYEGRELVAALTRFGDDLGADERAVLGEVLLERAEREGVFREAFMARIEARGWLRRRLDALDRASRRAP